MLYVRNLTVQTSHLIRDVLITLIILSRHFCTLCKTDAFVFIFMAVCWRSTVIILQFYNKTVILLLLLFYCYWFYLVVNVIIIMVYQVNHDFSRLLLQVLSDEKIKWSKRSNTHIMSFSFKFLTYNSNWFNSLSSFPVNNLFEIC